ncbi:MAG TPA: hypothetical protein VG497_11180 [Kribbella sp.]|nr:hypothetical protein [Kribbella sp.]
MTKGGARNRSGPQKDPNSGRSDRLGFSLTTLPAEGYRGGAPEYPLRKMVIYYTYVEDGEKVRAPDDGATDIFRDRESELWEWAWTLPQAAAWAREPWRWHTVAMWVRTAVVCEGPDAQAADKNSLHRFADQIGMTPAGLRENGWAIAADEVGGRRGDDVEDDAEEDPRTRLTVVSNGGA